MVSDALHALPVVDCKLAAARQVLLRVDGKGAVAAAHTTPGQYVKVALPFDEVPRPYAIASAPGNDVIELLLKVPEERVAPLLALGAEDKVTMSRPQGKGYPIERIGGHHLWLFAVGSGIAPLRAVLEHLLPRRNDLLDVKLLYGVREPAELAFTARFGAWAGHGIQVLPVVSRAPPDTWDGRAGHIQDHLPKELPDPARTLAFICGLPAMDREVSAQLLQRGVGPEQVFRNW
jgi:NAD(P)H-flavin reductase